MKQELFNKLTPEDKLAYLEYTVSKESEIWWDSLTEKQQREYTAQSLN